MQIYSDFFLIGIESRLDYLQELGIDAIWLSPIFKSPMKDFGYDVSDYMDIDPIFGTLEDFQSLLSGAHERSLKVILDFVPNHSRPQSFTSLKADLCQDINGGFAFSRWCLNGTFP